METNTSEQREHLSKQYHQDLESIRSRVLQMGGLVEQQFKNAIDALYEGDIAKAEQVIESDVEVNDMDVSLGSACTQLIVKRQPAANDLRTVMATTKIIADLERVGDEIVKIAKSARNLKKQKQQIVEYKKSLDVIANTAAKMMRDALDAFARSDKEMAIRLIGRDALIDHEFHGMMHELIDYMTQEPLAVSASLDVLWAAKAIERIGDHATNIAEQVIYVVDGKDIRHSDYVAIKLGQLSED